MSNVGEVTKFGHDMRNHFLFDPKWTNVNHGSFGTYPKPVRNAMRGYQKLTEAAPDRFLKYQYVDLLDKARTSIASLLNAPVDECVFVLNATTGINTVLRNLTWKPKDAIIYFDTVYSAIEKSLVSLVETHPGVHLRRVDNESDYGYVLPATHAEILNAFSQTISRLLYEGYNPKVAVFDTIASLPGARYPFERMIKICKEYGIFSVVDGAHGIGHIPLDLTALDPDFFTSNCHKWLYTPRGCAVLFVPKRNQDLIRTTFPTSHGYRAPPEFRIRTVLPPSVSSAFVNLFQFMGTADNCPFYCVPVALNFRANVCGGETAIYDYTRDLAQRAADLLADILGTKVMDDLEPNDRLEKKSGPAPWTGGIRDCAMANVLLPMTVVDSSHGSESHKTAVTRNNGMLPETKGEAGYVVIQRADIGQHIDWIYRRMTFDFNTHVLVFEYNNQMWTRISGQTYLELRDFEWLGGIFKDLLERIKRGESLQQDQETLSTINGTNFDLEAIGEGVQDVHLESDPRVDVQHESE